MAVPVVPPPNLIQMVSVVIPAYAAADTLGECLEALKSQRLPAGVELEIVVVDDCSPDATGEVALRAGVRCVRTEKTQSPAEPEWLMWRPKSASSPSGPAMARNLGVKVSSGDPILFTDSDCVPTEGWAAALLEALRDPEVAGVKGAYLTRQHSLVARFVQLEYSDKYRRTAAHKGLDFIDTYSAAYRRDIFEANGGFDTAFPAPSVEDQEFSFRLAAKGYKLVFAPRATVHHQHDATLAEYVRRKFWIGYWKAFLLRWHPDKALGDSHTPLSQRLQILLAVPALLSVVLGLVWRPALWAAAGLGGLFLLTTLPFMAWVAGNDWPVLALALPVLMSRAVAQALGLGVGLLATWQRRPLRAATLSSSQLLIKRVVDITLAGISLILALPLIAILSLLIKLESPGPVIFRQIRIGQHGRPFQICKLRSMVVDAEERLPDLLHKSVLRGPVFKIPDDPRVTRLGRFLRRWSLDELPQLWNVLRGDMSLVGPRPEEPRVVALYSDWHRLRLAVKPGLTGPMQVSGRGNLSLDERVQLDLDYIDHYSLGRDLSILLRSVPAVITGDGAY